jgi:1,4-dihydroxy-2-naphthoyl-CoA hydrolase
MNLKNTIFDTLGINIIKADVFESILNINIDQKHYQHKNIVHGGVYALLAESAASVAAFSSLCDPNLNIVALEINANHLRASSSGILSAHAFCLHRGSRTLVYEIKIYNNNKLVSVARCTLMIIEPKITPA